MSFTTRKWISTSQYYNHCQSVCLSRPLWRRTRNILKNLCLCLRIRAGGLTTFNFNSLFQNFSPDWKWSHYISLWSVYSERLQMTIEIKSTLALLMSWQLAPTYIKLEPMRKIQCRQSLALLMSWHQHTSSLNQWGKSNADKVLWWLTTLLSNCWTTHESSGIQGDNVSLS